MREADERQPRGQAGDHQDKALPDDEIADRCRPRAERQPDGQFAPAQGNRPGEEPVDADRRQDDRAYQLEQRIEHLSDVVEAMWDVLGTRLGLQDSDLAAALDAVHARREELSRPVKCLKCGAAVLRTASQCQFCGEQRAAEAKAF